MESKKEEVPPAYVNDTPDIHDEKPTGAIVQEEAVHSVALTEALAAGPKPSIWSKSMLQLYAIMAVGYLVSTLNGYDSSLMGAINAMKSYQNTFGLTGEGSSTGIIFIIYNCECYCTLWKGVSLNGPQLTMAYQVVKSLLSPSVVSLQTVTVVASASSLAARSS